MTIDSPDPVTSELTNIMKASNYSIFYQNLTAGLRRSRYGARLLNLVNRALTLTMYILYPLMIVYLLLTGFRSGGAAGAIDCSLPYILVPGISFVLLSIVRNRLNWKRPYEEHDLQPLIRKNTKGQSMPSRHVFSCTVIAMCVLSMNLPAGMLCLLCSLILCVVRVLGGVHYPRDVAAGLIIGLLAGSLLFAII